MQDAIPTVHPMMSENVAPPNWLARREGFGVCVIILSFLFVTLLSATRTPTVYMDEVEYTDPAANLYLGSGFTSTVWGQDRHEFWCGNVPLYQGMLFCFFKLFGFGFLQVRMATTIITAMGGMLIWAGLKLSGLVRFPLGRLLSLTLVLSGSVSAVTFRVARYDAAMFFVCALVFFACTLQEQWRGRCLAVILSSALLPFTGIALLPYAGMLLLVHLCVYHRHNIGLLISAGTGFAAGLIGLFCFYQHFGVWRQFVEIILPFTSLGHGTQQQGRTLKTLFLGDPVGNESLMNCFFGNPTSFLNPKTLFDYSAFVLFIIAIVITWKIWRAAEERDRRLMVFIIAVTLTVPPVLLLTGHYRSFYRWMTYIPLAVVVPRLIELAFQLNAGAMVRRLAFAGICSSLFLGVPLRTLSAIPDWRARSASPIEDAARKVLKPTDIVLCSFKAYYAVRPYAREVYCLSLPARGEFALIKDFPANDVSLLCIFPMDLPNVAKAVGGQWEKVQLDAREENEVAQSRYDMVFYRRVNR